MARPKRVLSKPRVNVYNTGESDKYKVRAASSRRRVEKREATKLAGPLIDKTEKRRRCKRAVLTVCNSTNGHRDKTRRAMYTTQEITKCRK